MEHLQSGWRGEHLGLEQWHEAWQGVSGQHSASQPGSFIARPDITRNGNRERMRQRHTEDRLCNRRGQDETAYWKNVLRKLFVDGVRIPIVLVVDYYHASERLTTISDTLKLDANDRTEWLSRMRKTLLEPGGHGRVLRSTAHMKATYGYKSALAGDARKA